MSHNYTLFDSLIGQNQCFSVCRMPGSTTLTLMLQQKGTPENVRNLSELNGKEGFVIAPFRESSNTPIVLIHPDIMMEGEENIFYFLAKFLKKLTFKELGLNFNKSEIDKPNHLPIHSFPIYKKAFECFQAAMHSNKCKKIVLSRTYISQKPANFSAGKTFKAACDAYPEAFVYLCHTPITGTWLGSSPEMILSGSGANWQTVALAGTLKSSLDNAPQNWDEKNKKEQQIVTAFLEKQLKSNNLSFSKKGPYASKAGRLMHLKTDFNFKMTDGSKIGDLLQSLHPTPAVCGYPKEEAYRLIIENEGYDRAWYSGFIGQLSTKDSTNLFVNLRCMRINPNDLTLFAGGGLLPSSDLETEWIETEEKLQTILSLIEF